jgi:hypothetical protein
LPIAIVLWFIEISWFMFVKVASLWLGMKVLDKVVHCFLVIHVALSLLSIPFATCCYVLTITLSLGHV